MPHIIVLGGPHGAGKTTAAQGIVSDLEIGVFVNADEIERGLAHTAGMQVAAGRQALERMDLLVEQQVDFAVEATLSAKALSKRLRRYQESGYTINLLFFYLHSADLAVQRVALRVERGGHDIPVPDIRRRYERGLQNFFGHYRHIADHWFFYDNSLEPILIASSEGAVRDEPLWQALKEQYDG